MSGGRSSEIPGAEEEAGGEGRGSRGREAKEMRAGVLAGRVTSDFSSLVIVEKRLYCEKRGDVLNTCILLWCDSVFPGLLSMGLPRKWHRLATTSPLQFS